MSAYMQKGKFKNLSIMQVYLKSPDSVLSPRLLTLTFHNDHTSSTGMLTQYPTPNTTIQSTSAYSVSPCLTCGRVYFTEQ